MVGIPDGAKGEIFETVFHFFESIKRRKNKCPAICGLSALRQKFRPLCQCFFSMQLS